MTEIKTINKVTTKIHFLPKMSDKNPTGTIVEAKRIPMKYIAPINPILYFDSHKIGAYDYQFSTYYESDSSGLY
jgi:hypothetical protein